MVSYTFCVMLAKIKTNSYSHLRNNNSIIQFKLCANYLYPNTKLITSHLNLANEQIAYGFRSFVVLDDIFALVVVLDCR